MEFKNTEVWGFKHAIRGMRQPMNSHHKSDSGYCNELEFDCPKCVLSENCLMKRGDNQMFPFVIGENDMNLAQRLIKGGTEHRKFLRQIMVSVDITAPLFWWKEFDTYKIGTTANSTSTMHKLSSTPITTDCFELSDYTKKDNFFLNFINHLEELRKQYLESKNKTIWKTLIEELPESWLQTRTVTMNYENLRNMYFQRKNHKLTEWSEMFIEWVDTLPYAAELIKYTGGDR